MYASALRPGSYSSVASAQTKLARCCRENPAAWPVSCSRDVTSLQIATTSSFTDRKKRGAEGGSGVTRLGHSS